MKNASTNCSTQKINKIKIKVIMYIIDDIMTGKESLVMLPQKYTSHFEPALLQYPFETPPPDRIEVFNRILGNDEYNLFDAHEDGSKRIAHVSSSNSSALDSNHNVDTRNSNEGNFAWSSKPTNLDSVEIHETTANTILLSPRLDSSLTFKDHVSETTFDSSSSETSSSSPAVPSAKNYVSDTSPSSASLSADPRLIKVYKFSLD